MTGFGGGGSGGSGGRCPIGPFKIDGIPAFRAVDQHSGEVAARPSRFFQSLDAADEQLAELEALRADRAGRDELELELAEARERNLQLVKRVAELRAERDRLLAAVSARSL